MKVAFPVQMRRIDELIIERGIPSVLLMENASRSVLEEVLKYPTVKEIAILCGGGNNGGDGYAIGRLLLNAGKTVSVIECCHPSTPDAIFNASLFVSSGGGIHACEESTVESLLSRADMVIDSIFGTGFHGELQGRVAELVEYINGLKSVKLAVDIPSGVSGFDGSVRGIAFRADKTVTFGAGKVGHYLYPGRDYCGEVVVRSEGFSREILDRQLDSSVIDEELVLELLPERHADSHKGTYGAVLIVGGSEIYTGAPFLSALGALRSGCGLTYTYTPAEAAAVIRSNLPEVIAIVGKGPHIFRDDLDTIVEIAKKADSIVIGPGIGRNEETAETVLELLKVFSKSSMVLDADGLYALSKDLTVLSRTEDILLTPHPGEFRRLCGETDLKSLMDFCENFHCRVILKGSSSVLCNPYGKLSINITGTTGLAKGGSGDLLSGTIGSFAAQTGDLERAGILGMYFMGKAAELSDESDASNTASSIGKEYSRVFSCLVEGARGEKHGIGT